MCPRKNLRHTTPRKNPNWHFLLESFKEDVASPVIPVGAYASTVRRRLIDVAGKIVFHGNETILKVSRTCFESLHLSELFKRCHEAPAIT